MADEKEGEKERMMVPALTPTAWGISEHAEQVQAKFYDRDRKSFRDPSMAMLALFTYCRLTARRLAEAESYAAMLTTRIAKLEAWQAEVIEQSKEMTGILEKMEAEGNGEIKELKKILDPVTPIVNTSAPVDIAPPQIKKPELVNTSAEVKTLTKPAKGSGK